MLGTFICSVVHPSPSQAISSWRFPGVARQTKSTNPR